MAITSAAAADLRTTLRAFRAAHSALAVPTSAGRALEAWVLIKFAHRASMMPGWNVSLRRGNDTPLPAGHAFAFPAGGTGIRASHLHAPMFILLEHSRHGAYELHGSLTWKGRSGATHECDVSLLPRRVAHSLRTHGGGHPHGLPLLAIECKDRTTDANIDEMRQMLARLFDLALVTKPSVGPCRVFERRRRTRWGRHSSQYRALFKRGLFVVARSQAFQPGAETLGSHYRVQRFRNIYGSGQIARLQWEFENLLGVVSTF